MKKLLSIIAIGAITSIVVFSCKSREAGTSQVPVIKYEDTVGLAQFQSWKAMNERAMINNYDPYNTNGAPVASARRGAARTSNSGTMTSTSTHQAKAKKGWSNAAKYSAIGGGGGIVLGAVVNKRNRVAGGAIGGVLGGGLGYLLGRAKDKREGRY